MEQHLALHAVLIPSLLAAFVCGASRFLPFVRRITPMLVPLAIAAVAVRAGVVQEGASILSTWPPAAKWISALACIAAMGVAGAALLSFRLDDVEDGWRFQRALAAGLIAGGTVQLLLEVPGESARWTVARAAIAAAMLTLVLSTGKARGPGIFLSLAFPAAALAGLLLLSGSAKLAVTAGSAAFVCGLLGLLAIPLRVTIGAAGIATMVVAMVTLAAEGRAYDYDSFPSWIWLVVTVAPVAGLASELPLIRLLPRILGFVLRVGPPLVISGLAVVLAAWKSGAFTAGEASDPYGP